MADLVYEFESPLSLENAIELAESLCQSTASIPSGFNDVQRAIFVGTWQGKSYREIAEDYSYDWDYVKQVGARLWRSLSKSLDHELSKKNLRQVLTQYAQGLPPSQSHSSQQRRFQGLAETRWVGRESLVMELSQLLQADCRIINLVGITGIGKTSLAMKLTLESTIRQRWPSIYVIRCDRQENVFEQMAHQLLGGRDMNLSVQKSKNHLLYALIEYLAKHSILIVLDMVEEILETDESSASQYLDSLFLSLFQGLLNMEVVNSRFILTSQIQPPEMERSIESQQIKDIKLRGLSLQESRQLFSCWEVLPNTPHEGQILQRLSEAYEGHPLALQVIAGEIKESPFFGQIETYWTEYGAEIEQYQKSKAQQSMVSNEHLASYTVNLVDRVEQRIQKSFLRLKAINPLAYMLICMGSVFRQAVEQDGWLFLVGDETPQSQDQAFDALKRRFLLEEEYHSDKILYRLHSLIRSVAGYHLDLLDREA